MNSGGMMGGGGPMMGRFGPGFMRTGSFFPFFSAIVIISGIIVVIGAILLSKRPQEATIWGIIVLVFSVVALVGMGLSILGSIIGIIGGVIALSSNRSSAKYSSKSTEIIIHDKIQDGEKDLSWVDAFQSLFFAIIVVKFLAF